MVSYKFDVKSFIRNGRVSEEDISEIRNWCIAKNNVPDLTDQQICLFLFACEHDLEQTKKCIISCYDIKFHAPELFDNRDIDSIEMQKLLGIIHYAIIPTRTADNHAVVMIRITETSAENFNLACFIKLVFMAFELNLQNDPPAGIIFVADMLNVGFGHVLKMRINILHRTMQYIQEGMMIKIKQIHCLNSNWCIGKIYQMCRPFMNQELINKIFLHPQDLKMEDFFEKYIPQFLMPSDYGGKESSLDELHNEIKKRFVELKQHFEDEFNQRKSLKHK